MSTTPDTIAWRPNERLRYWRHHDLGDATLLQAHYGAFKWEKHVHDEQVVVLSERGSGEVRTRDGAAIGGPGTIWVFAPGEYHFGKVERGAEWRYRGLYLDQAALDRIAVHLGVSGQRLLLRPGLHDEPYLARLLLRAHDLGRVDRAYEELTWNNALAELFTRYGDPQVRIAKLKVGEASLSLSRDYIAANFRDDISIDDLARLAGISRYHFIRAFKKEFGLPPHAYINQVRLQNARKLLMSGRSAADSAAESGFYDQSRLNALFKRVYGVTPGRYAHLVSF